MKITELNRATPVNGTCKSRLYDCLWRAKNFVSAGRMKAAIAQIEAAKKWLLVIKKEKA